MPSPAGPTTWLVDEFGSGGIARYAADVADLLHPEVEVRVATTDDGPAPGLRAPSQAWFPVGGRSAAGKARGAATGLLRAVARIRPGDVAWVPLGVRPRYERALVGVLRLRRAVVVGTVHNRRPHEGRGTDESVARIAARCNRVVVHTAELRTWARERGLPLLADLPFPVSPALHTPAGVHDRASLGARPGDVLVALPGNLRAYKGVQVLIEAVGRLPPDARVRVVLAGSPGPGVDLRARVADLGDRLTLLDRYLPDGELADVLDAADVVVLPYLRVDHSGMAQLAAARGLVAVASDLPALRETFGPRARYVAAGVASVLADALTGLHADLTQLRAAPPPPTVDPEAIRTAYRDAVTALLTETHRARPRR